MHSTVVTYGMPRKAVWVQALAYRHKYGFNSVHLVLPNLYGPGDHFDPVRSHALGALIKKIVDARLNGQREVEIWGSGRPVREWGYVADSVEGIIIAMEKYDEPGILNIGSGQGYSIEETANMIKRAVGWNGSFSFDLSRPDGAPKKVLDVTRMKKLLAWQPLTPIEEGVERTVAWYIEKTGGTERI